MAKSACSIDEWQKDVYNVIAESSDASSQSRWEELRLWSQIGRPYLLMILYKPSKRIPYPKSDSWMTCLKSAVQIAQGYGKQAESGDRNIKYIFEPCHQCFAAALVFLQAISYYKAEVTSTHAWEEIQIWMNTFSRFFAIISERWAAASRCLEEYERLLAPIKREYLDLSRSKTKHVPQPTPNFGTELDELYNSWAICNSSTTTYSPDLLSGYAYSAPSQWRREFNLDLDVVMENIPRP
jgi:hypothetical protein